MKCPDCGQKLFELIPPGNEFVCHNENCPANIQFKKTVNTPALIEYYGKTQEEINKQKVINYFDIE